MTTVDDVELPKFKCHKVVSAAKVLAVTEDPTTSQTHVTLEGVEPAVQVPFFGDRPRHIETGGYLVKYDDGFTSWSPAKAFEAGYTALPAFRGEPGEKLRWMSLAGVAQRINKARADMIAAFESAAQPAPGTVEALKEACRLIFGREATVTENEAVGVCVATLPLTDSNRVAHSYRSESAEGALLGVIKCAIKAAP